MNGYIIAAGALGLWWLARKRALQGEKSCGCPKSILAAAEPHAGTDCIGSLWQRLHGADLAHPQYRNYSGVSPDPDSAGKVTLAAALNVGWNGDAR